MVLYSIFTGGTSLPFFYESPRRADSVVVARQMRERRFDSALILGTGSRCRFGCPRVIVCAPLRKFLPFPTTFWLTCPWLTRLSGTIESEGGVAKLGSWIESRAPGQWVPFNMFHQLLRMALLSPSAARFFRRYRARLFERLRGGGAGGIQYQEPHTGRV
ncbi:MAG: DUF501 domain-containing protein, partial [Synergistaceae bacterium]|nr:DUF501 domain-containing protein [Synergistaceae bacterium]